MSNHRLHHNCSLVRKWNAIFLHISTVAVTNSTQTWPGFDKYGWYRYIWFVRSSMLRSPLQPAPVSSLHSNHMYRYHPYLSKPGHVWVELVTATVDMCRNMCSSKKRYVNEYDRLSNFALGIVFDYLEIMLAFTDSDFIFYCQSFDDFY
jgi:hypothetical protein